MCLGAIAITLLYVVRMLPQPSDILMGDGGDDVMRLQQVRDWLAGQSWFDTQQYRLLPPEGVSMHWSRYVDLGIAAFLVPASWFMSQTGAELVAVILWPILLGCLAILVIAHATNRLMGPAAAIGALVTFLTWGRLGGEFTPGRVDHHNLQILIITVIFYLSVIPGRPRFFGVMAGVLTAGSLAVGLEMLPFLALIWGMMVLRHAFAEPDVGTWLAGFCLAFAVAAPLLLAGQTPVSGWWVNHCDVLAPPVLGLAAIGIVATLVPVIFASALPHPAARTLVPLAITAGGLWLARPLLLPCLAGPYAQAGEDVRIIIETRIVEALPASMLLKSNPEMFLRVVLPALVIGLLAAGAVWLMRDRIGRTLGIALVQAFVVAVVGFAFALLQIRASSLMTPAIPLLAGFLVHTFATIPRDSRLRIPAVLLLLLAVPAVVEDIGVRIAAPQKMTAYFPRNAAPSGVTTPGQFIQCRTKRSMDELANLPKSIVFSSLNLGPAIIGFTQHSATSAGYHRSTAAFSNGVIAFQSRNNLRDALYSSRADYLVICIAAAEEGMITHLEDEGWPDWLIDVSDNRQTVRLFLVDKAALEREIGRP